MAEVEYQLNQFPASIFHACVGVYLLEQKHAIEERQAANLLAVLRGRIGDEAFQTALQQQRASLVAKISTEGFEHLLQRFQ
jgi:hypothetical protein